MVLYNPFHDFHKDIGDTTNHIIQKWENFQYKPCHIDRTPIPLEDPRKNEIEDAGDIFPNLQKDSRENEWEIISGLYKNKFINFNEFDMIGLRDRDVLEIGILSLWMKTHQIMLLTSYPKRKNKMKSLLQNVQMLIALKV